MLIANLQWDETVGPRSLSPSIRGQEKLPMAPYNSSNLTITSSHAVRAYGKEGRIKAAMSAVAVRRIARVATKKYGSPDKQMLLTSRGESVTFFTAPFCVGIDQLPPNYDC